MGCTNQYQAIEIAFDMYWYLQALLQVEQACGGCFVLLCVWCLCVCVGVRIDRLC